MVKEVRCIITPEGKEVFKEGYFLNIKELARLCRDFQADCFDGFVSNDESYIESQIEKI